LRFLADMGVADATVAALRDLGHDVVRAREVGYQTLPDAEILAHARSQTRIVLTFDLDFGDLLAAAGELLPSVVLLRTHDQRAESVTPRVLDVAARFARELETGALIVVEDARVRLRRLPLR
jgi:predicted nuclease of predicted toxin-antitoxin system